MSDLAKQLGAGTLTSEQVDAITYAYLDVCATDKVIKDDNWDHSCLLYTSDAADE